MASGGKSRFKEGPVLEAVRFLARAHAAAVARARAAAHVGIFPNAGGRFSERWLPCLTFLLVVVSISSRQLPVCTFGARLEKNQFVTHARMVFSLGHFHQSCRRFAGVFIRANKVVLLSQRLSFVQISVLHE
jgi:hypothetical protein